ncbi:hypothetical protein NC651_032749 [Populus alba x Populus x berolinensis]|nr:hypothetical protein NC651_032749 [Populus alba x Populus x berolinensis]
MVKENEFSLLMMRPRQELQSFPSYTGPIQSLHETNLHLSMVTVVGSFYRILLLITSSYSKTLFICPKIKQRRKHPVFSICFNCDLYKHPSIGFHNFHLSTL